TEMLLAVAGLNELDVKERAKLLAGGDWSSFKAKERAGLHLAPKLTKTPWAVGAPDIKSLTAHLGPEHALDTILYICWCNYMKRGADEFQTQLERENVFRDKKPPAKKKSK